MSLFRTAGGDLVDAEELVARHDLRARYRTGDLRWREEWGPEADWLRCSHHYGDDCWTGKPYRGIPFANLFVPNELADDFRRACAREDRKVWDSVAMRSIISWLPKRRFRQTPLQMARSAS